MNFEDEFKNVDGVVVLAGAGMGVDAGIPDFRGKSGIWTAEKDTFIKYSTADSFHKHPLDAWNFYITRFLNYSTVEPHAGYYDLLKIPKDIFVITSNIDGHFKKAGYDHDRLYEIHGNLEAVQCSRRCSNETQPMPKFEKVLTDESEMPRCPHCGEVSRPQVMLFNDPWFVPHAAHTQSLRFMDWEIDKKNILGIEIGAGLMVPSIRIIGEERTHRLIRINPNDHGISRQQDMSIPTGALDGIKIVLEMFGITDGE